MAGAVDDGASVEKALELWVASLHDMEAGMPGLFTHERSRHPGGIAERTAKR